MPKKVNWQRRFNDVRGVLDEYTFPVSTAQVYKGLKKWGIDWGLAATWQTLVTMAKTQRIDRIQLKGKDYWSMTPKFGTLEAQRKLTNANKNSE